MKEEKRTSISSIYRFRNWASQYVSTLDGVNERALNVCVCPATIYLGNFETTESKEVSKE